MATALVSTDYRIYWLASDCVTCIGGLTDAGVLETLGGFSIDIDFTTGNPITVDVDVPLAGNDYVYGIDIDLQQTSAYAGGAWDTSGGFIGIRSDVRIDYKVTNVRAVDARVYIDPAATCAVNDAIAVFGNVQLNGPFTRAATSSSISALRGDVSNASSGSYDGQVFCLMMSYGSNVNYGDNTALIFGYTHADARCDYGFYLNNYSPYMTAGIYLSETAGATPAMTYGIHIDAACGTGIYLDSLALTAGDSYSGVRVVMTAANPNNSYGTAAYFDTTLTGTSAGGVYNTGSWLNMTTGYTPSAGQIHAVYEGGIYDGGATLTNARFVGLQLQSVTTSVVGGSLHWFRFNCNDGASNTVTAIMAAANPGSACFTAGAGETSTKNGDIAIADIVGSGVVYVRTYDAAG